MSNYVPGMGPSDAKIMFVGEAPGADEDRIGLPFQGKSGQLLDSMLREVGVRREDVYVTNVVKYRPPANNLKLLPQIGHSIEEGIPQLWKEVQTINPNIIVPLGNLALQTLTGKKGILTWRGSLLHSSALDYKVMGTIHPAALLRSSREDGGKGALPHYMKYVVKHDLELMVKESETRKLDLPVRNLEIIRDHVRLQRFFDMYKDRKTFVIDIEVIKCIPVCIGFAFNRWHGVSIPLLDILSWQNNQGISRHELGIMWKMIADFLARKNLRIIGQNIKFDQNQLANVCGIRIPPENIWLDTMFLAAALYPEFERKLAFWTSILTREPYYKDEGKEFNFKKDKIDQLLLYNAKDCVVEYEVAEEFLKEVKTELVVPGFPNWLDEFFFGYQMKLHDFYRRMESHGLLVDKDIQRSLIKEYEHKIKIAQKELDDIAGFHVNVASPKQVAALLFIHFKLPERQGVDEASLVALEANVAKKEEVKRAINLVLLIRRLRKSKGTYFEAKPDYDGYMKTVYKPCGTETGRSSTTILKPPVRPEKLGLAFQTMTKHGDVGSELRSEFVTEPGRSFVESDLSQAEARIVALLAEDYDLLKMFDDGTDVHTLTSTWVFNIPAKSVTKEYRFCGKQTRHAGSYGLKKHRLMELINTRAKKFHIDISISEWRAGQILEAFHRFSPKIRGVFHPAVLDALSNNNMTLVNPFGRIRQFFGPWGEELWKEAYAHIPQSTVPDHLRKAGLRIEKRIQEEELDAYFVIEAHDAFIGNVKDEHVPRYIEIVHEELEHPIDFSRCTISRGTLVIPPESKVGKSYKECDDKKCGGCHLMHTYHLPKAA